MTRGIPTYRFPCPALLLSAFLLLPFAAHAQTTLTGAVLFSTDANGAYYNSDRWDTLGPDNNFNLWLALNPNATSPVNGPSDAEAAISIPLEPGRTYKYYIFGQPGSTALGYFGLNLFFDGNNSTPGISAFGALNTPAFLPDGSTTLTLQGASVPGAGTILYGVGGVAVLLTAFHWDAPATPPGDVCNSTTFTPGGGQDFFGSFTLQVFPAASLTISQPTISPGTAFTLSGSGFAPVETVDIHTGSIGGPVIGTVTTDAGGSFSLATLEPAHTYGPLQLYAVGEQSHKLGFLSTFVEPNLTPSPKSVGLGGTAAVTGLGFGAAEMVDVYLDTPRILLGTATANSKGSFGGSSVLTITIPPYASLGLNSLIGIGETTGALAIGDITIK